MSNWETFTFKGKSAIPKITIRKGGQIGLNSYAVEKYNLNNYQYVILRINKAEKKIGIKPTNDDTLKGVHKLKIIQGGGTIAAKNFIGYYELNDILGKKIECEWDDAEEMIVAVYSN
jgi:hypothetical protein